MNSTLPRRRRRSDQFIQTQSPRAEYTARFAARPDALDAPCRGRSCGCRGLGQIPLFACFTFDPGQAGWKGSRAIIAFRSDHSEHDTRSYTCVMFTDYYAEQSCTAGRSSFITGQCTLRTGLSKVGIPAATVGLQATRSSVAKANKADTIKGDSVFSLLQVDPLSSSRRSSRRKRI